MRLQTFGTVFALALGAPFAGAQTASDLLRKLCDEYTEFSYRVDPVKATAEGRAGYDHLWPDLSARAIEERNRSIAEFSQRLHAIPSASLAGEDLITYRLLDRELAERVERSRLDDQLFALGQQTGIHTEVLQCLNLMPERRQSDYENIIARLKGLPVLIDQQIALLDEALAKGLAQPRVVVDLVVEQLDLQSAPDAAHSPVLAPFRRMPSSIPERDRQRLSAEAAAAYEQGFVPAWKKFRAYLTGTYAAKVRKADGIASVPGGKDLYRFLVRTRTTTSMTPEEIHRLGEQQVARIEAEMQAIARQAGFQGTLREFEAKLNADPEQRFHSKDDMLAWSRNVAKTIEPELPRLFANLPWLLYGVRAIPEDREASTATHAEPPPLDRSRPGWFDLNTYRPEEQVKYDKQALVIHEAVPGHLLQIAYAQAAGNLPTFRKTQWYTAYGEGWALYAESLGGELGLYRDPYSRLGQLSSDRFRAVRLVVDTGIHAMGWTRDQAVAYFREHAPAEPLAEVDRYISWPGQALAYKIGQLRILELRKLAEERLGPNFDIREFHYTVLRHGGMPLDVLEEQVQAYIDDVLKRKQAA